LYFQVPYGNVNPSVIQDYSDHAELFANQRSQQIENTDFISKSTPNELNIHQKGPLVTVGQPSPSVTNTTFVAKSECSGNIPAVSCIETQTLHQRNLNLVGQTVTKYSCKRCSIAYESQDLLQAHLLSCQKGPKPGAGLVSNK